MPAVYAPYGLYLLDIPPMGCLLPNPNPYIFVWCVGAKCVCVDVSFSDSASEINEIGNFGIFFYINRFCHTQSTEKKLKTLKM